MKKQAKLAFDRLEEEMEMIPEEELENYMGGKGSGGYGSGGYGTGNSFVDSLLSGHVIDLSGLSQSEKEEMKNRLVEIDSEPMGDVLLHDIKNSMTHSLSISFHSGNNNEYNHIIQDGFSQNYFDQFAQNFKDGSSMNEGGDYDAYADYISDANPYASTLFSFDEALSASGY